MYFFRTLIFLVLCSSHGEKINADPNPSSSPSYAKSLQHWKTQIKKLQDIRDRVVVAQGDSLKALRKEY